MRFLCSLLILFLLILPLGAQDWGRINELTYDAEYFFMTKQYDKAIKAYSQILSQLPDNANIKYKLGVCYLNTDTEKEKAIPYFNEASANISQDYNPSSYKEESAPLETYFLLGSAYRVTNQLDKAAKAYRDYLDNLSPKETKQKQIAEHYLKSCQNAALMMSNPVLVTTTNLGNVLNDETPNFNAVFSGDGQTVVYTSTKRDVNNIMYSNKVNGEWTKPKVITRQITSKNNFKTSALSMDGTKLYLVEEDPFNSEIYISTLNRGRWSSAVKLKKPINSKMNETHASLSPDEKTLYFTSDRSGGEGDLDIYYSQLDAKGRWGKPVNMGPKINTMFNEETPFVSPDGKWLYFSSEGHEGMGGYDVYRYDLQLTGSEPVNLGYPINTTDNDLFYLPGNNKYEGYYSRLADNGFGDKDIYAVEIHPTVQLRGKIIPDNQPPNIDTNLFFISIMDLNSYNTVAQLKPENELGEFSHQLTPGKYLLSIAAPDYETFNKEISIEKDPSVNEMTINANLIYTGALMTSTDNNDVAAAEPAIAEPAPEAYNETKVSEVIETPAVSENIPAEAQVIENVAEPAVEMQPEHSDISMKRESEASSPRTPSVTKTGSGQAFIDEVVDELNDVSSIPAGLPVSYTVQIFALSKPVDLSYFRNLDKISVHLDPDNLYKYTWGVVNSLDEAKKLSKEVLDRGYRDVIIRRRSIVPVYTIQVMAGKTPVNFKYFDKLERLNIQLSKDGYYRYYYGEYGSLQDANEDLSKVKALGYQNAFVKRL
jgi:hypothetical protein